jgi:large subunit ribosomal protein L2
MAVVKVKPTSPGRRAVVKVVHKHLHKGKPEARCSSRRSRMSGRNNNGHITMRHKGGGHKHHYRVVDFRAQQGRHPGEGRAHRVRPEPHRPHRAAVLRRRRAPLHHRPARRRGRRHADESGRGADQGRQHAADPQHPGGSTSTASRCCRARARRSRVRPARRCTLMAREGIYAQVRLRSGEVRKVHIDCRATIGECQQRRAQPAPVRQGRCQSAGRASARPCAVWR